ncbi:hypothetical protein SAMN05443543_11113 [Flavobacterium flevense]|uniref:Arginyl-tRNA synthetase n=1 Tax=Flavobacterium flevense TaxID=983 RepID=A0A4Y4B0I0_9FLAO|nr:hypothetical protein [Flavobacterium flevense]GEC72213.1 hypothetical protein FFL01_17520 [Flavobacterium flevense]SHM10009.1 hypothetical protein SAMN05443543_11113 [Flavobacterium flevense]
MNLSKIIAIVLIILSLFIGYIGINKVQENTNKINFLGIKIEASDESGQQKGYLYIGFAVLLLAGGLYSLNKSK